MFHIKVLIQAITPIIRSLISSHHCGYLENSMKTQIFFLTWSEFICVVVTVHWPLCEIIRQIN